MDNNWYSNPKFLDLAQRKQWRAIAIYWAAVAWSAGQGMDGRIPAAALPILMAATSRDATELVKAGLWEPDADGWMVHDWSEYQLLESMHKMMSERGKSGAAARWGTKP
jgi:hypothetical protein